MFSSNSFQVAKLYFLYSDIFPFSVSFVISQISGAFSLVSLSVVSFHSQLLPGNFSVYIQVTLDLHDSHVPEGAILRKFAQNERSFPSGNIGGRGSYILDWQSLPILDVLLVY